MAQDDSPRHPPAEGRDHTASPARNPGSSEAGQHPPSSEPGKTPSTSEGGRETTGQPWHQVRTKRPRAR
jgi:hypothetical protein